MLTDKLTTKDSTISSGNSNRLYDITLESSFSQGLPEEECVNANEEVYYNTVKQAEQFYIIPQNNHSVCREYRLVGCICCIGFFVVCVGILVLNLTIRDVGKNLMSQLV